MTDAEPVLRLALQFLDLHRDVDRNRDDSVFRDDGGHIHYAFDANIFEIFMRPSDSRGYAASLHASTWPTGRFRESSRERSWLAAQTALLTSEYLLSGELPGQESRYLYLSEWHSWEFARRVRGIVAEYSRLPDAADLVAPLHRIADILRTRYSDESGEAASPNAPDDPTLSQDIRDIEAIQPIAAKDKKTFATNRLLLKWLADETNILQLPEQLKRLLAPDNRKRLRILHLDFRPDEAARTTIGADARSWYDRLLDECERRGIKVDKRGKGDRNLGALWDDARTLALVRWAAANRVGSAERLVLVTADPVLFDVYRKWYVDLDPLGSEFAEPFVLRRLVQYAPIFNLAEATNSLGEDVRAFFRRLQEVLEITLLPINLARRSRSAPHDAIISRMREKTALRLLDRAPLASDVSFLPLVREIEGRGPEYQRQLEDLLEDWRRIERTTLGIADNYVARRFSAIEEQIPGLSVGQVSNEVITRYLDHLIRDLYEGSVSLWLPLARQTITDWMTERRSGRSRAPTAFRLRPGSTDAVDLGQAMQDWLDRVEDATLSTTMQWAMERAAADVAFAVAACVALASEDWGNADSFADMALQSGCSGAERMPEEGEEWLHELRYLNALTKRFRIGMLGPVRNVDVLARIRRLHREANDLLQLCIDYHVQDGPLARHELRLVRALSERAALNLFHAASLASPVRAAAPAGGRIGGGRIAPASRNPGLDLDLAAEAKQEAEQALSVAERDLIDAWEQLQGLAMQPPDRQRIVDRLWEQVAINTAAAHVLRRLMSRSADDSGQFPDALLRQLEAEIRERWLEASQRRSPLLEAELLAFLHFRGEIDAKEQLKKLAKRKAKWSLSLDAALFSAITGLFMFSRQTEELTH